MKKHHLIGIITLLLFMVINTPLALAQMTAITFDFSWDIQYDNVTRGDWLNDNSVNHPARGVYVVIEKRVSLFNWSVVSEGYADEYGEYEVPLPYNERYRIKLIADAEVGDNSFTCNRLEPPGIHYQYVTPLLGFVLTNNYYAFTYQYLTPYKTSNVMAAATLAFYTQPAGVSNDWLDFLTEAPTGGATGGYNDNLQEVRLSSTGRDRKFTTIHEIGHFMNYARNGHGNPIASYCSYNDPDWCPCGSPPNYCKHGWYTKEKQGCAAKEGFANFYAAAVLNDPDDNDCEWQGSDCYYNDKKLETDCHPPDAHLPTYLDEYGTESDWTEFYWDLYTQSEEWTVAYINMIFAETDNDWDHDEVYELLVDTVDYYEDANHTLQYFETHADNSGVNW